ncbi:MAG TPA: hypothetical protein VGM32_07390 [Rhodopila sp.]
MTECRLLDHPILAPGSDGSGGTYASRTGDIGPLRVQKIENKHKQNRRIVIVPG